MALVITPAQRLKRFWRPIAIASRRSPCRRIRRITIRLNTCGRRRKKRATHNKYFKEFAALTVSVEKALAYFATYPDTVLGLFGRYCGEMRLGLTQPA